MELIHPCQMQLRPTLNVTPLPTALVELVDLPPGLRRIAQVNALNLLRLDYHDTEVLPRYWIVQVLNLRAERKVLVVIRFAHWLARRRCLEATCYPVSPKRGK